MKIDPQKKVIGHLSSLLTVIFFALNIPATTYILDGNIGMSGYVLLRTTGGVLVCWIASLFMPTEKIEWKKDFPIIVMGGVLGLGLFFYLYGFGIEESSPIDAAIILTITPIMVLIVSAFTFHEKITKRKLIGIFLALGGALMVIILQGHAGKKAAVIGNIVVLLAALLYGIYLVYTRGVSKKYNPVILLRWFFLSAFIVTLPLGIKDLLASELVHSDAITPILVGLYIAIFPSAIAYMLIPLAMKSLSSTVVSMYNYAIPIIASVVSIALGQAVLRWDEPIATFLVIIGVYLVTVNKKQKYNITNIGE